MTIPDFTNLTLIQFAALLFLVAAVDIAVGILSAIVSKTFSTQLVADFIVNHVLLRVLPIVGMALFGAGITPLGVPGIPAAAAAAAVSLAAYVVETIGSLQRSLAQATTPSPTPPAVP